MSAERSFVTAVLAAMQDDPALAAALNMVADGPVPGATPPWAELGPVVAVDWGSKDRRGREVQVGIVIHDRIDRRQRIHDLVAATGAAIEAMPRDMDGWRLASLAFVRLRVAGEAPARWTATIEYRARLIEQ
ncbi:DUF3168 domain-containing protein [uncultured Sphingomonas sp.]|uniref:DUF3168 domain-containing protein n=1 Tax=uncultured Sphingomonas sp. TaxID=158754 RepID=UPI0035CC43C7